MQLVQDLKWLLTTPPMYQGAGFVDEHFIHQFKQPLIDEIKPHSPASFPISSATNFRLGHYYEALWIRLLQLHPDYQLLLHNWPIYHKKRTLGALDFVVEHRPSQTLEHWELALKFYLLQEHPLATNLSQWVGPNKQDTLANKITQMQHHQLPLSAQAETQQQLAWFCRRPLTRCRGIIQGRYYWPKSYVQQSHVIRPQDGYWCYQAQLPNYPLWQLPKPRWLTGLPHSNDSHMIVDAPYPQHGWDPFLSRYCFVVPNNW